MRTLHLSVLDPPLEGPGIARIHHLKGTLRHNIVDGLREPREANPALPLRHVQLLYSEGLRVVVVLP